MSLTLPASLGLHLLGDVTNLTVCWAVTKHNDEVLRGTAHDRNVTIDTGTHAGTYLSRTAVFASDVRSTSDGSVSNVDVEGAFRVDAEVDDLKVDEIEGGLYDQAPAVLFAVNWKDPNGGQRILVSGTLGEFFRDADGRYRSEVRGLAQALAQQITRTYSTMCDVKQFGDARCMFDVVAVTRTATVTAVESRQRFDAQLDAGPAPLTPLYYNHGRLKFTSGANTDFVREVRLARVDTETDLAEIRLWDDEPADIAIGDTFELPPGCDRQYETCRLVHNNLVNFRGYGIFAAGRDALMRGAVGADGGPAGQKTLQELVDELGAKLGLMAFLVQQQDE